jgi:hypothetical protein
LKIINIDENYLSSDAVSIALLCLALPCFALLCLALAYFLDSPHPSLKYAFQFFLIDRSQNRLQALIKLVLVSHLNPFECFNGGNE